MISLLLSGCLALASTNTRTIVQSKAKFADTTYQYRCVEDETMGWSFLFLRAQGCTLKGSGVSITTKDGSTKNYHLHEIGTCEYGTKLFLGNMKCSSIFDLSLNNVLTENK